MTQTKRLDILDLPRDKFQFTGTLRTILVKLTNFVRKNPRHAEYYIALLTATLKHATMNYELATAEKAEIAASVESPKEPELSVKQKLEHLLTQVEKVSNMKALTPLAMKISADLSELKFAEAKVATITKYKELITKQS